MIPKIRVWDTHEEVMNRVDYIDFANGIVGLSNENVKDYEQPIHRVEIMQSTNLLDRNGVEIYEGDILKCTSTIKQWERELFNEIIGEVAIEIGMTYIIGKCKHGYLDEEIKESNYKALLLSPDLFEVIGNIHSNPELLKSEE